MGGRRQSARVEPELVYNDGLKAGDVRKALRVVAEQRAAFMEKWESTMAELTDEEIEAATERGRIFRETHPRAKAARYDPKTDRVIVELLSGATFAFPPRLVQGLHDATPEEITEVEVIGAGYGLHWESLDIDYSVPGLINGVFGTAKWMAARAGRATSPANGRKGGRPRVAGY